MRPTSSGEAGALVFGWGYSFITSARSSIWRHGVSIFRTGTLITAWNIHTLVGTQMANGLGALVDVWMTKRINCVNLTYEYGMKVMFSVFNRTCLTFTGMPILPEVVALSAIALVGTIDVSTFLTAWAGQTLIHIWRLEVRAHYCHNSLDQRIFNVSILTHKQDVVIKPIMPLLVPA